MSNIAKTSPVTPSVLARHPQRIVLVVAVVSLMLHSLIAAFAYHQPIGRFDAPDAARRTTVINVRQAQAQPFSPALAPGLEQTPDQQAPDPLHELTTALLQDDQPPTADAHWPDQPLNELRPIDEQAPEPAAADFPADPPSLDLLESAFADLHTYALPETRFHEHAETPSHGRPTGSPASDAAAAAHQLLAQAGSESAPTSPAPQPRPTTPAPTPTDTPELAPPSMLDQRMLDFTLDASTIDFAADALDATTRLHVPEQLDHDFDYFITRYETRDGKGYFRLDILARRSLQRLPAMPKDITFLIDTSGSVPQEWVRQVARGVSHAMDSFNEDDRFNIVLFADQPNYFRTDQPAHATSDNIQEARAFLAEARSHGGTDLHGPLSRLLVRDHTQQRVHNLILISDGIPTRGVTDNREIINAITRNNDRNASIYAVGITLQPNRELLDFLTYRNAGFSIFSTQIGQVANTIRDLVSRLRYPLITDVQVRVAGDHVHEIYPLNLPNIHQGERFSLYGQYDQLSRFTIQVTGNNDGQPVNLTHRADLNRAGIGDRQIAADWAFAKLHHLYSQIIHRGQTRQLLQQIQDLRREYRLRTLY